MSTAIKINETEFQGLNTPVLNENDSLEYVVNSQTVIENNKLTDSTIELLENSVSNNNDDKNPSPTPTETALISPEVVECEPEYTSNICIDIDNISTRTGISKNELQAICVGGNTSVAIPTDLAELQKYITINEGCAAMAATLAKKSILTPEARSFFLKKAQSYSYLWLKGEVQLGNAIRNIKSRQGRRYAPSMVNEISDLDTAIEELRSKKEILEQDYNMGYTHARQLVRLTDELVEKEYQYALANNDSLSRTHALSFLNRPAELSETEQAEVNVEKIHKNTKAKFDFETTFSNIPFDKRKNRVLKKPIFYASIAACVGSDEYYLEQHGFVCKVALECDDDRAEYFELMHKMRSKHKVDMIVGKLEEKFDELVTSFKKNNCELAKFTIPCQTYCAMRGKDWKDDDRLLLVLWSVKFVKDVKPKYILFENAKEFFGFSLPMTEDLSGHPIAQKLQQVLNGRTIGQYLNEELGSDGIGYNLNFSIENAAFYGSAQNRVRSIMLGSLEGLWKFPCPEKFAMPLWQIIGHLPSIEAGEDSGILYHKAPKLHNDPIKAAKMREAFAHLATGCRSQDNDPKYQLSGFGYFGDKGTRKFWDKPSNTIDGGNVSPISNRTLHPGRLQKDGTYSDCRVLTLLEIFLVNGLPQDYQVPEKFKDKESFIREVMGEIFLPKMLERICLEIPVDDSSWIETTEEENNI